MILPSAPWRYFVAIVKNILRHGSALQQYKHTLFCRLPCIIRRNYILGSEVKATNTAMGRPECNDTIGLHEKSNRFASVAHILVHFA